jgi:hypothetical protein
MKHSNGTIYLLEAVMPEVKINLNFNLFFIGSELGNLGRIYKDL